jgi:hypothetical protein
LEPLATHPQIAKDKMQKPFMAPVAINDSQYLDRPLARLKAQSARPHVIGKPNLD